MSMPEFPEGALEINCQQAFHMLLGSIAMEELALSHIMNAEGEKLQYILGTLPGKHHPCVTTQELLEVNRSVGDLLDKVADNQVLLRGKLRQVLQAWESCCPPEPPPCPPEEPPCPPEPPKVCVWTAECNKLWYRECPLPWSGCCQNGLAWQGSAPGLIHLCPGRVVLACLSLEVCPAKPGPVRVALKGECKGQWKELLACTAQTAAPNTPVTLSGCVVLAPQGLRPAPQAIELVLDTPDCLQVERGALTLVELT